MNNYFFSVNTAMGNSEEDLLNAVNERNTKEYIPAIVVISVVLAIGICLNILATMYYGFKARKSVFQIFVVSLSINFLITDFILIYDIVELQYFVSFTSSVLCKLFYVLKHWFVGNAVIFMISIGFERYRSVCFPFSKPLSFRTAWWIIVGLTTLSFVISVSLCVTTDIVPIRITTSEGTTQGSICNFSESENLQTVRMIFHIVDIVLHSVITCVLVFFYTFIVRKLIITRRKVRSNKNVKNEIFIGSPDEKSEISTDISDIKFRSTRPVQFQEQPLGQSPKQCVENMEECTGRNENLAITVPIVTGETKPCKTVELEEIEEVDVVDKTAVKTAGKEQSLGTLNKMKHAKSKIKFERTITIIATLNTVATIACFMPFYVSMMAVSPKLDGDGHVLGIGIIIARRSFMLISVVNPIIMIIFNDAFRQYVKEIFIKLFSKFQINS